MLEFHKIVVRDEIDHQVVHRAFLEIDEYAEAIDRSLDGARDVEPWLVGITHDLPANLVADLKSLPCVELATAKLLDAAELDDTRTVSRLLRAALQAELDCEAPVHMNVQALWFAVQVAGTLSPEDIEPRWQSIREALRNP